MLQKSSGRSEAGCQAVPVLPAPNESLGRNAPMLGRLPGLLMPCDDTRDHIRVRDDLQNEETSIAIVTIIRLVLSYYYYHQ